jgi:nitrite reductase/ring-hydroxylating ferredoxin subunit
MTNDSLPYIGILKDNVLIGTGYNTWGLTNGFLAGKILSDIILGNNNEYINIFDPKRINLKTLTGSFTNCVKTIIGYIKGLKKNKNIIYNKKSMTYKCDENEYTVRTTCPHAGCKLLFNEIEKTWDCPCHGSKFDNNGKCINSPSNKDITIKSDE